MSYFGELLSTVFERRYSKALSDEVTGRTTSDLCEASLAGTLLVRFADMSSVE